MVASLLERRGLFFLMVSDVLRFLVGGWTSGGSSLAGDEFDREDSEKLLSSVAEVSALFLVSVPSCLYSLRCMRSDLRAVERVPLSSPDGQARVEDASMRTVYG